MTSATDDICPLERYFQESDETKTEFMRRTGVKHRTLFDLLGGVNKDYGVRNLRKIETGTGGRVTIRMMVEWLDRINQELDVEPPKEHT